MTRMITQSKKTVNGIELKTPQLIDPPPRTTVGTPPEKITVACVWWGNLYPVKYVENLRNSVNRNLSIPHDIVCITNRNDVPDGVMKIPTPLAKSKTWWQKISLFSPDLFDNNQRILYLDLDTVIINSLDKIASVQEPFCIVENFSINKRHCAHNSSVMVWTPSDLTAKVYNKFSDDVVKELHGDQCFVWRVLLNDNIWNFPKSWVISYKYEKIAKYRHKDKDSAVVCFHGNPKPHQVKESMIKDNWK